MYASDDVVIFRNGYTDSNLSENAINITIGH